MLIALDEPSDFDRTSWTPAASSTARTGPPAMTPVPGAAGRRSTTPAAFSPCTGCGMVPWMRGTLKKCFLASSTPLAIAAGTSLALPYPTPTMPSPSPTITRAVKLKPRPPLTTLATRLIATTRSAWALLSAPWPRRSSRPPRRSPPPLRRCGPLMGTTSSLLSMFPRTRGPQGCARSEREAALAGALGEGGDPPVVLVAGAVEHHALDACSLGPLGDELADLARLGRLVAVEGAEVRLHRARGSPRPGAQVVDGMDADVLGGPGDDEARALRRSGHLLAATDLTTQTRGDARAGVLAGLECDSHRHLPAFPTLRRICSPAYRTPLPLYGSGLRSLRMFAATSPTSCLSMP